MKVQRAYGMNILPIIILIVLVFWQLVSFYFYSNQVPESKHLFLLGLSTLMAFSALFFRDTQGKLTRYVEGLIDTVRAPLIGISCLLIGGIHFISILGKEPIYLQMIYVILIIAYFETSGMALDFYEHYSDGLIEVTRGTMQRLFVNTTGKLAMVLVLSVMMLYLSLLVIVGFTGPFSVAFLAAIMMLAIAFMTLVRRL